MIEILDKDIKLFAFYESIAQATITHILDSPGAVPGVNKANVIKNSGALIAVRLIKKTSPDFYVIEKKVQDAIEKALERGEQEQ